MKPIRVVVQGASGRMGQEVIKALCHEPGTQLVGAVELQVAQDYLTLPDGSGTVPFSSNLDDILTNCRTDVLVDFTIAQAIMPAVRIAANQGVNLVIGTTGLTADDLNEIDRLATAHKIGAVVAPNFALGAVLMMHLAKIAAKCLDYAEIIELHHHHKADPDSRGKQVEGVTIHSVRLPGLLAHQEVLLGGPGQTLSIRHDTISRECYMPGIMLAIREVVKRQGLIYGLDTLLDL